MTTPSESRPARASLGSVLVVDDDPTFCRFVDASLRSEGYHVATAPHGAAALAVATQQDVDLILLDLTMPVMDGRTFAAAYRELPVPHAPIVLVTGVVKPPEVAREAEALHATGFVLKPLDVDTLLETTRRLLPATGRTPGQDKHGPGLPRTPEQRRQALHRLSDDLRRLRGELEHTQYGMQELEDAARQRPLTPAETARTGRLRAHGERLRLELDRIRAEFQRLRGAGPGSAPS